MIQLIMTTDLKIAVSMIYLNQTTTFGDERKVASLLDRVDISRCEFFIDNISKFAFRLIQHVIHHFI
jgi:hypothetical protein